MANKVPIVQATFYNNNTKQIENCYPMTSAKGVVMSDGKTLEESFSDKADDSNVVHKSGNEEILGRKTFDDLRANGFSLSDNGDWNRWVSAFYSFLENKGIIQFGTEEDWSVILRNIADPEYENDAATKGYVDTKISSAEENLVHKDGFERITGRKQFQNGINIGLFNSLVANQDGVESGAWLDQQENPAPFVVADPTADDHAATKHYVDEGLVTKANLLHKHTVADITDFPELYYDATAFFASGAYPSDRYEELLQAVKAKKTVYATIDEGGNISYVFFMSLANSDASSSRVLLTTIFVDGSFLYLNTFVLQQSGMTRMQESITGKADKATTLAGYGIGDAYTKSEMDAALAGKQSALTAGNGISIEGNVISSTVDSLITPITYAELVALRDSSSLVAGMQYRITDYACTTTQENTQSAGHPFDIIVTADSKNTLNEKARAIKHEGDTYFADCDLNAWKIWYCLDNDSTRFAWADSANGKGVIYRMIDEWNNDVPYDFKNIRFARDWSIIAPGSGLAGTIYCYTFSIFLDGFSEGAIASDESVKAKECIESDGEGFFGNNKIALRNAGAYLLNDIIFFTDWAGYSVNHFSNTFGGNCRSNTFGDSCNHNTFGDECYSNTFGGNCSYNTFGGNCSYNTFGNSCNYNTFGDSCNHNTFGDSCYYNTFGDECYSNTFGGNCSYNTFGISCVDNTFGDSCYYNTFGNSFNHNTFGNGCESNTFGNSCQYIKFASPSSATTKYNYYRQNHFGDGCQYILFKGAETASSTAQVQNYNFAQGLQGTSSAYLTIDGVRSRAYETKVAKNTSGELKIYCEADLIQ